MKIDILPDYQNDFRKFRFLLIFGISKCLYYKGLPRAKNIKNPIFTKIAKYFKIAFDFRK
ncbi:MAG TPA: hypothetical protein DCK79_01870 [Candidatus Atribacteria bacterium]|nr:hypothetical protein [Candidatus Atribacteria bacterium]